MPTKNRAHIVEIYGPIIKIFGMTISNDFPIYKMGGRHQSDNMGLSENLGNPAVYGHVMVILWSCSLWMIRSMQIGSSSRLRPSRRPPMCLAVSQLVHPKVVWQCYACHHSGKICKIHGFWMFLEISSFDSIHVWGSLRSLRES